MGDSVTRSGIAIVGMAGRFPGAASLNAYWQNILDGRDSTRRFSRAELRAAGLSDATIDNPSYVPVCGELSDIDLFDAGYFGYSPRDAALLDPQQRLFLETATHALEHAGYPGPSSRNRVGVFAGASMSTYLLRNLIANPETTGGASYPELILHNDKDTLATRLSYHLDLQGPSLTVQTACSTSLVAVHLAAQALRGGECDLALAGGVSVQLPQRGYLAEPGGILSPAGRCLPFDARADGIVPGSGVAVVVLKPLADAHRDGDTVHAVILGSAVNNDGGNKVGYTAPRIESQAAVVRSAQHSAGVVATDISYLETHGTGTPMGDPIEVAALTRAFRAGTGQRGYCALGSVKAQIGHLDAAAGVAGLIKTVQALRVGVLPPSPYLQEPNPALDLARTPFYLPTTAQPWPDHPGRRCAGVSSIGMGGTNAHVIVAQPPEAAPRATRARRWQVLPLSARTAGSAATQRAELTRHLTAEPNQPLAAVAYTLQVGRRTFPHRVVTVASDHAEAAAQLAGGESNGAWVGAPVSGAAPVVFMFPGQGAQHVGMARGLYETEPRFRQHLDQVADLLREHGIDLLDLLYGDASPEPEEPLTRTGNAQPALFAVEYALAQLWMEWGVRPTAMIGHSVGEFVAACLAGTFPLPDAARLVAARGALMERMPPGAMLAVGSPAAVVARELPPDLVVAADNAPASCVVAGETAAVDELAVRLEGRGVAVRRLRVSHAFHSPLVQPAVDEFAALAATVPMRPPQIPFVSIAGQWITPAQATDPRYWSEQMARTVRFREGMKLLLPPEPQILLEVGPGRALCTLVREQGSAANRHTALPSLGQASGQDDRAFHAALARIWAAGGAVDWQAYQPEPAGRVPLPGYPFERRRHWVAPTAQAPAPGPAAPAPGPAAPSPERLATPPGQAAPTAEPVLPAPEPAAAGSDDVSDEVRTIWGELLGVSEIGLADDFFQAGGTSLLASRVVSKLNARFSIQLPAGCLFDAPTVGQLTSLIWNQLAEQTSSVSHLLAEIQQLSPDEVRSALGGADISERDAT